MREDGDILHEDSLYSRLGSGVRVSVIFFKFALGSNIRRVMSKGFQAYDGQSLDIKISNTLQTTVRASELPRCTYSKSVSNCFLSF